MAAVLNSLCAALEGGTLEAPIANRYILGHLQRATEEMVATRPTSLLSAVLIIASFLSVASAQAAQPLFDAHLHFDADDATHYTPEGIVARLQADRIVAAAVTSKPSELVLQLHALAPVPSCLTCSEILPEQPYRWTTGHSWNRDP